MRKHFYFVFLFTFLGCSIHTKFAEAQTVDWQITINNVDNLPQLSGSQIAYRVQLQCSALSENEALNTEIRFPGQDPTYFSLGAEHPTIESFSYDVGTNEWIVDFQDIIFAGTNIEFDILAHSPNHTTANGTTFDITATIASDNATAKTATDNGEWSATANLGVEKYLQFGPDTDALLDIPVKYYLYPCDPSFSPNALGHLYIENWTLVDELPTGVIYNNSSGSYDSNTHTVTWSDPSYIENEDCNFEGESDYWVEVTFPSSVFGAAATPPVLEATNTATFEGYAIGTSTLLSDSDALLHGFTLPNPSGNLEKDAQTNLAGYYQDITTAGGQASFNLSVRTESSSSLPYYFKVVDILPCLDNTPNAATQYESPGLNDPICSNMAFQPTDYILMSLSYNYLTIEDPNSFAANNPTLPLDLVTSNDDTITINIPFLQDYFSQLQYQISWADIQSVIGNGVDVTKVIWDSEAIGVQVIVTAQDDRQAARLSIAGNVADDTPAYPMLDQYRVRNYAHFYIKALDNEQYIGAVHDDVIIFDENPIVGLSKWMFPSSNLVTLSVDSRGGDFKSTDSLIVTDLLPLGYTFGEESQQYIYFQEGNWYWSSSQGDTNSSEYSELDVISIRNYIEVEVIDDYNGTGRQLVRATFLPPPIADVWENMTSFRFSFYLEQPAVNMAITNTFQMFPTDPTSAQNLLFQPTLSSYPSAPYSNDVNDLDGDGVTVGDAYGEDDASVTPSSTIVDIRAYKAVKGDASGLGFEPFPAVADITELGGTAEFQINVQNIGGIGLENFVIYDILPHIGDTGLSETQIGNNRESAFDVTFTGLDMSTLPTGAVVEYSTSTNPCRNELTTGASPFPTGCINDWSTTIPSPIGDVKALRITFPSGDIQEFIPGESLSIEYGVTYPSGVQLNEVAWSNFAYAGNRMDDNSSILPTEVPKVGIARALVDLTLSSTVSSTTNFVGDTILYTITIDHEGHITEDGVYTLPVGTATNVVLTDDYLSQGLTIVPNSSTIMNTLNNSDGGATFDELTGTINIPAIGPLDTYVITYYAYSDVVGSITNTMEIMSHPNADDIDSTPGNGDNSEDDYDQVTASWIQPSVDVQALVESYSGSGVYIEADDIDNLTGIYSSGQPVNYQFVVTNTGDASLSNISLMHDLIAFECDQGISSLVPGASTTVSCTWPYGFSNTALPHINLTTVTANANVGGNTFAVEDTDSAAVLIVSSLVQGHSWYDEDKNGMKDENEPFLQGVTVKLHYLDETVAATTTTNAFGFYEFKDVAVNDYYISFDESSNMNGYSFISGTEQEANNDSNITDASDSDIDPYSRRTPDFNLALREIKGNIDAGFVTSSLPVELLYFTGENRGCENVLYWATATEENNSHFVVEHSIDGIRYESLVHIEGNGNSSEEIEYSFTHDKVRHKYNYYRLTQVDYDGTTSSTEAVILESDCDLISNTGIMIYPNPTMKDVNVELFSEVEGEAKLTISDLTGRILNQSTINLNAGISIQNVDLTTYDYGVYMFSIEDNNGYHSFKVVKTE